VRSWMAGRVGWGLPCLRTLLNWLFLRLCSQAPLGGTREGGGGGGRGQYREEECILRCKRAAVWLMGRASKSSHSPAVCRLHLLSPAVLTQSGKRDRG
jgi:hypothetical protein